MTKSTFPLAPRWRGDPERWSVTLGTALNLLDNAKMGLKPSELVAELRRLQQKYDAVDHEELRELSGQLEVAAPRVVGLVNAVVEWGKGADDGSPIEYSGGFVVLTPRGKKVLGEVYSAFAASRLGGVKSVDMHEPLLCWNPNLDGEGGWGMEDGSLAPRRITRKKMSYRQWLTLLHKESKVYVGVWEKMGIGMDPDPESVEGLAREEGVRKRYAQIRQVRGFAKLVLGGGPEAIWMGKPLEPKDVHHDVEAAYAGGKAGFDRHTVTASSLAWDLYTTDPHSLGEYSEYKELLDMQEVETRRIWREKDGGKKNPVSGIPSAYKGLEKLDAEQEIVRTDPYGQEILMVGSAGETLTDRIVNPGNFGKIGKNGEVMPIRCTYVKTMGNGQEKLCTHMAVIGTTRCEMHGGLLADPEETRMLIVSSQLKMFALADTAVSTIADVMVNGTNESNRLRAAETILNRSGIVEGAEISINGGKDGKQSHEGETPGDIVRKRLENIAKSMAYDTEKAEESEDGGEDRSDPGDYIEGEVVESDTEDVSGSDVSGSDVTEARTIENE